MSPSEVPATPDAPRVITETDRLALLGLATILRDHIAWVDKIEDAIVTLLGDDPRSTSIIAIAGNLDSWQMTMGETVETYVARILAQNNVTVQDDA